jgi:hypothetical protein
MGIYRIGSELPGKKSPAVSGIRREKRKEMFPKRAAAHVGFGVGMVV